MAVSLPPAKFSLLKGLSSSPSMKRGVMWKPLSCSALPIQQSQEQATEGIMCDSCSGVGWLVCDFCQGKKTNVKSESKRIYRRCPSCRAAIKKDIHDRTCIPLPTLVRITQTIVGCRVYPTLHLNVGYMLCTKCKVFKCVTFPDSADGEGLSS